MTFIDDYFKYVWVYFLKKKAAKSQANFKEFKMNSENDVRGKFKSCIMIIGETTILMSFLAIFISPITIDLSKHTQQHGIAEWKNKHLVETCYILKIFMVISRSDV